MISYVATLGAILLWLTWWLLPYSRNVRRAKALGIPVISVPVSPMNVLWIVVEPLLFRILDSLPFDLGSFEYARRGWHFADKARSHEKLGEAFVVTTPRETFLHVCHPDTINEVFDRRQDFIRPVELYSEKMAKRSSTLLIMRRNDEYLRSERGDSQYSTIHQSKF